jgi:hypothetical protein
MACSRVTFTCTLLLCTHDLDEQATGSRPLTAEVQVRSQPVLFKLNLLVAEQVLLRVLPFCPVSIIPPIPHTHRHLATTLVRRTSGRSLGTLKQSNALSDIWEHWTRSTLLVIL